MALLFMKNWCVVLQVAEEVLSSLNLSIEDVFLAQGNFL